MKRPLIRPPGKRPVIAVAHQPLAITGGRRLPEARQSYERRCRRDFPPSPSGHAVAGIERASAEIRIPLIPGAGPGLLADLDWMARTRSGRLQWHAPCSAACRRFTTR